MNASGFHEVNLDELPQVEAPKMGGSGTALIQTSAEFVANFEPPNYLVDGLIQQRFLYSMTAPTGTGKTSVALRIAAHVAEGLPLSGKEIEKGKVLFFAGENPDDVRMRWIKLCEEMELSPETVDVFFLPGTPPLSDAEIRKRIEAETRVHGPFALIIIDTSAAYFQGNDENSNVEMGKHARMLRGFVDISGGPAVITTCHPKKSADMEDLLPRGGGAFLAEVDGNLICRKDPGNMTVELHWHGKLRGPDFAPMRFKLEPGTTERLKDGKGRLIWTVTARPITDQEQDRLDHQARGKEDELLALMSSQPNLSLAEMAKALNWFYETGEPNKTLVNRTIPKLQKQKLVKKVRDGWELTKEGKTAAQEAQARQNAF